MVLKFQPLFMDKIWGGQKLKELYGYETSDECGECWGISGHSVASNMISSDPYQGYTLRSLYQSHRSLFGDYPLDEFPILIKLIHAKEDLSIQVHPDNAYAQRFKSLGKEECWTILENEEGAFLYLGHPYTEKAQIKKALENKSLLNDIKKIKVEPGDFYYIPAGTLHAIGAGIVLLEVQQSSDLTFRLYDYDRLENGQPRELHIEDALSVMRFPDSPLLTIPQDKYFHYSILNVEKNHQRIAHQYGDYGFVMAGEGLIDDQFFKAGDFFMVPSQQTYELRGSLKIQLTQLK